MDKFIGINIRKENDYSSLPQETNNLHQEVSHHIQKALVSLGTNRVHHLEEGESQN
ncbi:Rieske 2Fe-2S family protein [Sesbania bispinosa]|nr:Rieske 2Fe-2S family protein [Sesbania bispinosa]